MALTFDDGSRSDESLWMGEALDTNLIAQKAVVRVSGIKKASSGKGFTLTCYHDDKTILDFVWSNSTNGRALDIAFNDPVELVGQEISVIAQSKRKNASLKMTEMEGAYWEHDSSGELVFIAALPTEEVKKAIAQKTK